MPSITQMREELEAKRKNLHAIFDAYPDVTSIPADEAKKIKPMNDELSKLAEDLEAAEDLQGIKSRVEKPRSAPELVNTPRGDHGASAIKSIETILRESKEYESFRKGEAKTASFDIEAKTLLTLTTRSPEAQRLPDQPYLLDETTVADLMLPGSTGVNSLAYYEETTHTHAAAAVTEGDAKPEAAFAWTERTDAIRKLAVWIPATQEFLEDLPSMQSWIEGRLRFQLAREEEEQLLKGDGTAPNISGILDRAIQTQARGTDPIPDAIYKGMTKVRVTGFAEPTAYVTNPNDWQEIRLLRTADGVYIWGNPSEAGVERIWGLTVRQTALMTENTGLVGAFRPYAQVFRRSGVTVTVSTEHSTYFTENKVAILAEERLGLAVYRPYAFCSVTGI